MICCSTSLVKNGIIIVINSNRNYFNDAFYE